MLLEKKYDVFVSYSHEDEKVAQQICHLFDEYQISYFLDKGSIKPASNWLEIIAESIKSCKVFLLLVSKNIFASDYSMMELKYAYSEQNNCNISILPYLIDDGITEDMLPASMKMMLNSIQWISNNEHPIGDSLIKDIKELLSGRHIEKIELGALPKAVEMHCYKHLNKTVAGYCTDCGKFLCSDCVSKHTPCLCDSCYETRISKIKQKKRRPFITKCIIGAILACGYAIKLIKNGIFFEMTLDMVTFDMVLIWFLIMLFCIPFGFSIFNYKKAYDKDGLYGVIIRVMMAICFSIFCGIFIFIRDIIRLRRNKLNI